MCINTHCTPIKFSKYYPTTNGKAGGQTTKKVKEPIKDFLLDANHILFYII